MPSPENTGNVTAVSPTPAPTRVHPSPLPPPASNWLIRGVSALARGELPYQIAGIVDRVCVVAGRRYKRLRVGTYEMLVRRQTWDEAAVQRIIVGQDYVRPGHEIQPADTVIDVGANIGCFAVMAGRAASQGRVVAFEPDSENFHLLSRNVELNQLTNVVVERKAVSGRPGVLQLFKGAQGPLHTIQRQRSTDLADAEEVPAVTLADIFERHKIDRCNFLKMNCEGAEYAILYNTPRQYLQRIDRIALEYHASEGEDKDRLSRELAAFLQKQGFAIIEFSDFVGFDCGYIRGTRTANSLVGLVGSIANCLAIL